MKETPEWVSYFASKAGMTGSRERLLHLLFTRLLHGTKSNNERMVLYAVLLAAEVRYAGDLFAEHYPYASEEERRLAMRDAQNCTLETLGETMHKLLGEDFFFAFGWRKPPEKEKPADEAFRSSSAGECKQPSIEH